MNGAETAVRSSLSARRAWIEISFASKACLPSESLSARRAWIEIRSACEIIGACSVALRKESVDRNSGLQAYLQAVKVALRKESVDRNSHSCIIMDKRTKVALRKESVDRNRIVAGTSNCRVQSLSARRAWIEIRSSSSYPAAALPSLSARRAWIEIFAAARLRRPESVALRKESVDRNMYSTSFVCCMLRRSPQGERG